jgi:hypothetical protein
MLATFTPRACIRRRAARHSRVLCPSILHPLTKYFMPLNFTSTHKIFHATQLHTHSQNISCHSTSHPLTKYFMPLNFTSTHKIFHATQLHRILSKFLKHNRTKVCRDAKLHCVLFMVLKHPRTNTCRATQRHRILVAQTPSKKRMSRCSTSPCPLYGAKTHSYKHVS